VSKRVLQRVRTDVLTVTGKSVPLQARRGPEGSRKLRFPHFMTAAQDGGATLTEVFRDFPQL